MKSEHTVEEKPNEPRYSQNQLNEILKKKNDEIKQLHHSHTEEVEKLVAYYEEQMKEAYHSGYLSGTATKTEEVEQARREINDLTPFVIGVGQDPLISKDAVLHIIDPNHKSNTLEDLYLSQEKEDIYKRGKRDALREHTCPKVERVEKTVYRVQKDHPRSKHLKFGICSNGQLVGQTYNTEKEALVALGGMARAKTGEMPDPEHTHVIRLQR